MRKLDEHSDLRQTSRANPVKWHSTRTEQKRLISTICGGRAAHLARHPEKITRMGGGGSRDSGTEQKCLISTIFVGQF